MWAKWTAINLWKRSLLALLLGLILGFFLKDNAIYLKPLGDTFLKLLKMMIVPLIFISLIHSIINLKNTTKLGGIALKSIIWFVITNIIAIILTIIGGVIVKPGIGITITNNFMPQVTRAPSSLLDTLLNIIPSNPLQAFVEGNVLQVLFLAIILGLALIKIPGDKTATYNVIDNANNLVIYIIRIIMELMPLGIFALLAYSTSVLGLTLLIKLAKFALLLIVLCAIQMFIVYSLLLKMYGFKVISFFKDALETIIVSFSTASSSATLPTNILSAKKMGISEEVRTFVLPLGTAINTNGSSMHQALIAIFIAQMVGFHLEFYHYFIIIVTTLISSLGTAGIPGVGLIMVTIVLNTLGLPIEGVAIVAGIDRLLDMVRTSVSSIGNLVIARLISKNYPNINNS